jgi:hypothetical protein
MKNTQTNSLVQEIREHKKNISAMSIKFNSDRQSNAGLVKDIRLKKKEVARMLTKLNQSKE